ncbi:helix-turn-helix domain-containing protein [Pseudooceanicola sp. 200-1SW]|uniref:helix-turn-helix domain-containing protein n=1 Tax=Pseudooceanicola sp. 200-1SW TaxID=3425949 RepID=UPI003D7F4296
MPKQARLSGIKSFRCYTFEEAAEVTGVSDRTIRNWASAGLRIMDDTRPKLIRGDDLRRYIKAQRRKRSVKTQIDTFYCFRCKAERHAAEGLADCDMTGERARLTALCGACGTIMSKPISASRVSELSRILDLKIMRH